MPQSIKETPSPHVLAYKAFDSNLRCREFQYEVGKSYTLVGTPSLCIWGFHACLKPIDVFRYKPFKRAKYTRFCLVKLSGKINPENFGTSIANRVVDKIAATEIEIVREIPRKEFLELCGLTEAKPHRCGQYPEADFNFIWGNFDIYCSNCFDGEVSGDFVCGTSIRNAIVEWNELIEDCGYDVI